MHLIDRIIPGIVVFVVTNSAWAAVMDNRKFGTIVSIGLAFIWVAYIAIWWGDCFD